MTPGGSNYDGTADSRSLDYGIVPEYAEFRASPRKKIPARNSVKRGVASNTTVHELLECPICMNVMYPPIHQVKSHGIKFL